jgi:hypothetical protein
VSKELAKIRKSMQELSEVNPVAHQVELSNLRNHMDELLYSKEMMWLQRSRISWLKEGDRNTKIFHRKTAGRSKKNKIKLLQMENGQITKDKKEMAAMACNFFKELYTADPGVNHRKCYHWLIRKFQLS